MIDGLEIAGLRLRDRLRAGQAAVDRLQGAPHLRRIFRRQLGYELNLEAPQTFNEKIQWRKLFDRRADYPVISDKLRLRDWVAERLGRDSTGLFVELYCATDDPGGIDFSVLPDRIAIKANHGSGWNIFLRDGPGRDRDRIVRTCREWLAQGFNRRKHEWAYWQIPPRIVVEELIVPPDGSTPDDLKLLMFDGACRIVQFDQSRASGAHRRVYMTPGWADMGFTRGKVQKADPPPRPRRWEEMRDIAEKLSAGFDFMRVDFLLSGERYALNEMTVYSGGGLEPLHPRRADAEIGAMWRLSTVHSDA